jgi:Rrf2 family transcriptional regulator, nitric oxide-sensitive transcriptional repressor
MFYRSTLVGSWTAWHNFDQPERSALKARPHVLQTAVYALRAMVQLSHVAPGPSSTAAIAESAVVPRAYLSKVLQELRKAGLVRCRRGVGGGVCLALPPDRISILQVVNAVEPARRFHAGPLLEGDNACLMPLHQKLDDAFNMLEASLSHTTLADVAAHGDSARVSPPPIHAQLTEAPDAAAPAVFV